MRSRVISGLAVAVLAGALAACGSSTPAPQTASTSKGVPVQSPAHAAYISRGDEVCEQGRRALAPIDARGAAIELHHHDAHRESLLIVPVLREGLHQYRRLYKRLAGIPPPSHDRATVETILSGLRRVGDDLERLTEALDRGETAAARRISGEREVDHAKVSALELEFGFKVCGQPTSRPSIMG